MAKRFVGSEGTGGEINQSVTSVKKPVKPTPLNLYVASKMQLAVSSGQTKEDIFKVCSAEYKKMTDDEQLVWILEALHKNPIYMVTIIYSIKVSFRISKK